MNETQSQIKLNENSPSKAYGNQMLNYVMAFFLLSFSSFISFFAYPNLRVPTPTNSFIYFFYVFVCVSFADQPLLRRPLISQRDFEEVGLLILDFEE